MPEEALKLTFWEPPVIGKGSETDHFAAAAELNGTTYYLAAVPDSRDVAISFDENWLPSYSQTAFKAVMLGTQSVLAPFVFMMNESYEPSETPLTHLRFYSSIAVKPGSLETCPTLPANCFYINSPKMLGDLGTFITTDSGGNSVETQVGGYAVTDAPVKLYRRSDCAPPAHQGQFTVPEGLSCTAESVTGTENAYTVHITGALKPNAKGEYELPLTCHLPAGAVNAYSLWGKTLDIAKGYTFADTSGTSPVIEPSAEPVQTSFDVLYDVQFYQAAP